MSVAEAIDKLVGRLASACSSMTPTRSENHWTAHTWQVFFEDLNCRAVFDSSGNSDRDRPDVQVWFSDSSCGGADIWIEAKAPHSFATKAGANRLLQEIFTKLESCLRRNEPLPAEVMITDFATHCIWPIDRFLQLIERGTAPSNMSRRLGQPISTWRTVASSDLKSGVKEALARWKSLYGKRNVEQSKLNLDGLVARLLAVSAEFRASFLAKAVSMTRANVQIKRLFSDWMLAGGGLAASSLAPEAAKRNVGVEEAFSELCFHSVMVRCFTIKWFLDHGYLTTTECARNWGVLSAGSSLQTVRSAICPIGSSPAERLVGDVFRGADVYLWILQAAPPALWVKIKQAFCQYSLVAERSDVLGEFYQRYMKLYAKEAQLLLGQFYTPHALTRAMWKLAGEVLRRRGVSLADESCLVVDPAVGTGTFLTQGIRLLLDGTWGASKRQYTGRELARVAARFTGFEVNPLSRGVAVVNCLTELLTHASDGCRSFAGGIRVFETNAYDVPGSPQQALLSPKWHGSSRDQDFQAWKLEAVAAMKAKQKDQYMVVVANPPWRNPSPACKSEQVMRSLKTDVMPWAWEYRGQKLSSIKGCTHGVREDYAFFMGLAIRLLRERGLMVYVTNESWLTAPTYSLLRKYLLDHFRVDAILRIGPYFDGVKERAAVVIAERAGDGHPGREQSIRYLDWSDLSNPEWSHSWIDRRLSEVVSGELARSAWSRVKAVGGDCRIRVKAESAYSNDLASCVGVEEIFGVVHSGAQSGCGPIFLSTDKQELERRVRLLFKGSVDELADVIEIEVRGGRKKAAKLIRERMSAIRQSGASFDSDAIRPVLAHFSNGGGAKKKGYCYFDPRIWLRPRTARDAPDIRTMWDSRKKLIFRDMFDPGDKKIVAAVETAGRVVDNHLFNGGVYVAAIELDDRNLNLTTVGKALRRRFASDEDFLFYIAAVLNSPQVQEWGQLNPLERVKVPTDIESRLATRMSKIEQSKARPWDVAQEADTVVRRRRSRIADLFGDLIDALDAAA